MPDDYNRYIEYLQSVLLSKGWEKFFDPSLNKEKYQKHIQEFKKLIETNGLSKNEAVAKKVERLTTKFEPLTRFETPFTSEIFVPCLERIEKSAKHLGLGLNRTLKIAASTEIRPTPFARPTGGQHTLFIGFGTSIFCNYWAKAYTAVTQSIARYNPKKRILKSKDLEPIFASDATGIILAARLALYYSFCETLIGFGKVKTPPVSIVERSLLLDAMELFIVGHEYGHFVAEERLERFRGQLDKAKTYQLEVLCDRFGLALSRQCTNENFFTFAGIGAIAFFRAIELCEQSRRYFKETYKLYDGERGADSGHPTAGQRIELIKTRVLQTTEDDQKQHVQNFIKEYDLIVRTVNGVAFRVLKRAFDEFKP